MKIRLCLLLGLAAMLSLSSCNDEEKMFSSSGLVNAISISGQDFIDGEVGNGTRAAYTVDNTGFHFSWTQGDTVGIYPVGGDQVAFPISSGEGSKIAQFDGGAWALRSTYSYAAYYPYAVMNCLVSETSIPVNYLGQYQNGNGSLDCLDKYDYQASVATRPDADGNVSITLKHLGCFVRFQITMPTADTYKSITLTSSKTPFVISGTFDLTQEEIAIVPSATSASFVVKLDNALTTDEDKVLTIYAMLAPSDLSDSDIAITVEGTTYRSYTATVAGKNMQAGKAYSYSATVKTGTSINGEDVEWDDNGQVIDINDIIDTDAPALESFTITTPSSTSEVDVTEAPQTIVFRAHLTDASGVDKVTMDVYNTNSNGTVGKSSFKPEFTLVSGDEKDGVYEATLVLDSDTRPGSYQCALKVWDALGNTPFGLNVVGYLHFTVINDAGDFDPPALESFTIISPSSSEVDVTDSPQTIVFRAHLTDASGIDKVTVDVNNTNSNGAVGKRSFKPEFTLVSGDEKDGVYEATLVLDSDTRPGSYQCALNVRDVLGNTPFWPAGYLYFTVINDAGDFDPPALESFTIISPSSSEVDVTDSPQTIVFRAHLTDASGVDKVTMDVYNTNSNGTVGKSSFKPEFTMVSGDEKDGVYEATLVLDADTRPGSYQCDLEVWDILGNTPFGFSVVGTVKFTVNNNN